MAENLIDVMLGVSISDDDESKELTAMVNALEDLNDVLKELEKRKVDIPEKININYNGKGSHGSNAIQAMETEKIKTKINETIVNVVIGNKNVKKVVKSSEKITNNVIKKTEKEILKTEGEALGGLSDDTEEGFDDIKSILAQHITRINAYFARIEDLYSVYTPSKSTEVGMRTRIKKIKDSPKLLRDKFPTKVADADKFATILGLKAGANEADLKKAWVEQGVRALDIITQKLDSGQMLEGQADMAKWVKGVLGGGVTKGGVSVNLPELMEALNINTAKEHKIQARFWGSQSETGSVSTGTDNLAYLQPTVYSIRDNEKRDLSKTVGLTDAISLMPGKSDIQKLANWKSMLSVSDVNFNINEFFEDQLDGRDLMDDIIKKRDKIGFGKGEISSAFFHTLKSAYKEIGNQTPTNVQAGLTGFKDVKTDFSFTLFKDMWDELDVTNPQWTEEGRKQITDLKELFEDIITEQFKDADRITLMLEGGYGTGYNKVANDMEKVKNFTNVAIGVTGATVVDARKLVDKAKGLGGIIKTMLPNESTPAGDTGEAKLRDIARTVQETLTSSSVLEQLAAGTKDDELIKSVAIILKDQKTMMQIIKELFPNLSDIQHL